MKPSRILEAFHSTPLAILPAKLEEIRAYLALRATLTRAELKAHAKQLKAQRRAEQEARVAAPPTRDPSGKVAVLNIFGTIAQRMGTMSAASGGTSTEDVGRRFDALLASDAVRCIVLNVDSPGGSVFGVQELADKIYGARGQKKTVAVANSLMASAAYWIASAASEVVVTPGGQAGSIGVLAVHEEMSGAHEQAGVKPTIISSGKYKAEGSPYGPLEDTARDRMQALCDSYYDAFTAAVARHRGVTQGAVKGGYGEGRVLTDKESVSAGLCDRVNTLEEVLGRLGVPAGRGAGKSAALAHAARRVEIARAE